MRRIHRRLRPFTGPRRALIFLLPLLLASGPSYAPELKAGFEAAEQGLWREARFRYERAAAAAVAAPDFRIYNNLAVSAEAQGDFPAARANYEKAIALAPDNRELHENFTAFRAYSRKIPGLWPKEIKPAAAPSVPTAPAGAAPASSPAAAASSPAALAQPLDPPPPIAVPGGAPAKSEPRS